RLVGIAGEERERVTCDVRVAALVRDLDDVLKHRRVERRARVRVEDASREVLADGVRRIGREDLEVKLDEARSAIALLVGRRALGELLLPSDREIAEAAGRGGFGDHATLPFTSSPASGMTRMASRVPGGADTPSAR